MKNRLVKVFTAIGIIAVLAIAMSFFSFESQKEGYINMTELFQEFDGTKERSKEVEDLSTKQGEVLDSLKLNFQMFASQENVKQEELFEKQQLFERVSYEFEKNHQQKVTEYDQELWSQINESVKAYGKEKDYKIIHGVSGDGNIMYADKKLDITEDVLSYINQKYQGQ